MIRVYENLLGFLTVIFLAQLIKNPWVSEGVFSPSRGDKIGDKFNQGAQGVALVAQGFICEGAMNPCRLSFQAFETSYFSDAGHPRNDPLNVGGRVFFNLWVRVMWTHHPKKGLKAELRGMCCSFSENLEISGMHTKKNDRFRTGIYTPPFRHGVFFESIRGEKKPRFWVWVSFFVPETLRITLWFCSGIESKPIVWTEKKIFSKNPK